MYQPSVSIVSRPGSHASAPASFVITLLMRRAIYPKSGLRSPVSVSASVTLTTPPLAAVGGAAGGMSGASRGVGVSAVEDMAGSL